jgi:cyclopropane fatty-acyl-phospholipid synthase-like methyltransferase
MAGDADENALVERFSKKYAQQATGLLKRIELSNCGCDYGSTSFTTVEQVDRFGSMLGLTPGKHLLDIGAGAGWPGLYLAKKSGCDVTLTDLPIEGLQRAMERAADENLPGKNAMVVASGAQLPFSSGRFDAVSHADVLCCLIEKLAVLKACREVISNGGNMVFSVILTTPGLTGADYRKAVECGPSFIAADDDYPNLIRAAGWHLIEQIDLSADFLTTLEVMRINELDNTDELEKLLGSEEVERRLRRTEESLYGVERGLIRRALFHALPE